MAYGHSNITKCFTSDGTSLTALGTLQLTSAPDSVAPNQSSVCVLDGLTVAYHNETSDDQIMQVKVLSNARTIWAAAMTVPAGEAVTLDKEFVGGLVMWKALAENASTIEDPKYIFGPINGAYMSSTTPASAYGGTVSVLIDGSDMVGSTTGVSSIMARYHFEPASVRRS